MAEETKPPENPASLAPETPDLSLEDMDQLLAEEDPEFSQQLAEVREAGEATDVDIEPLAHDDGMEADGGSPDSEELEANQSLMDWRSLSPKEILGYFFSLVKAQLRFLFKGLGALRGFSFKQTLGLMVAIALAGASVYLLLLSFKGRWIPSLQDSVYVDLRSHADSVLETSGQSWYPIFQALRQPGHRFLFEKFVVNLRRTGHPSEGNPMGLFEFFVDLNSQSVAVEVKARELELKDLLQRTIEGETHQSLQGERGKALLKVLIREELNKVLKKGWVEEVFISNMILNP